MPQDHPHIETIKRYYHGCNTADAELIKSTFTEMLSTTSLITNRYVEMKRWQRIG